MEISDYEFQDSSESMFAVIVGAYLVDHPDRNRKLIDFGKEIPEIDGAELASVFDEAIADYLEKESREHSGNKKYVRLLKKVTGSFPDGKAFVSSMSYEFARFISDICR